MNTPKSTADALLEATIESIHRNGLSATTVSTVTELAGLSRGMVRHNFSSKRQMLAETMKKLWGGWMLVTKPSPNATPADQVKAIVLAMFKPEVFSTPRVAAWLALSSEAHTDPVLAEIRERAYAEWTRQLADALEAYGAADPAAAAINVLAVTDGLWLRHLLDPEALPREAAAKIALDATHSFMAA